MVSLHYKCSSRKPCPKLQYVHLNLILNTDYKILTKGTAKRLAKVLPKTINPDQSRYIKNRYIGENICLIYDIKMYTEKNNIPEITLFIDFRKAFRIPLNEILLTTVQKLSISDLIFKTGSEFYINMFPTAF